MRLDLRLTKKYPKYSRSHIQKLIKSGAVLVNKKIVKPHYEIKLDDKITEKIISPEKIDLSPDKSIKLNIVYEDKNYIVINKSTGLVVHPSESFKSKTLVNALLAHYPPIKNIGDQPQAPSIKHQANIRPGIVHRLDKDASGLMVITKTQKAFEDLKKQFLPCRSSERAKAGQNHKIKKEYTALVYGDIKKDSGEISIPIGRSKKGYKMSARSQPKKTDKTAITKFKVIKRMDKYTLLKIQTLTGRTHQIRVHLQAIGHPIVNDPIYQPKKLTHQFIGGISRLFLHADTLEFNDLNNKIKKFTLPLPPELTTILKKLKSTM